MSINQITAIILFTLCAHSCSSESNIGIEATSEEKVDTQIRSNAELNVDDDFEMFIEKYSFDSAFQVSRTKFPLYITRTDVGTDLVTFIYKQLSEHKHINLSKQESELNRNTWEREIVVNDIDYSAEIRITGVENGIHVTYYFEKIEGKWTLIEINDKST